MTLISFIRRAYDTLSKKGRRFYVANVLLRVMFSGLDVLGVVFLGIAAALASGTKIDGHSLTGAVLQVAGIPSSGSGLIFFGCLALMFFVGKSIAAVHLSRWAAKQLAQIETNVSVESFGKVFMSGHRDFSSEGVSRIQRALMHSTQMIYGYGMTYLAIAVGEVSLILSIGIILAIVNPLALFGLGFYLAAVGWLTARFVGRKLGQLSKHFDAEFIKASRSISQGLLARRELLTSGKASFILERYRAQRSEVSQAEGMTAVMASLPRYILEGALMLGFTIFLVWRGVNPEAAINVSVLTIFVAGSFRIVSSMLPLQGALGVLKQASSTAPLALEIIESGQANSLETSPFTIPHPGQSEVYGALGLELVDVGFRHEDATSFLFRHVNESIAPNQMLLISGSSGAGKSSLAELILGLLEPVEGQIILGGGVGEPKTATFTGEIGYVPQRPQVVDGSIAENVTFELGSPEQPSLLDDALRLSGLAKILTSLPNGVNSDLSEFGGIKLSGGQLQRLGIARVIYQNARMLVLDEPVSSLDAESSVEIINLINRLKNKMTVIVISHKYLDDFAWDKKIQIGS